MNSNIDINLKSIKPFEHIKDENLLKIKNESELLQFSMGTTISTKDIIPNKILLILSGQARLLHVTKSGKSARSSTVKMLKTDDFIGIASLLRGQSCEFITASNDVLALAIPDTLVLNLYQEDLSFKSWFDKKIHLIVEKILKIL